MGSAPRISSKSSSAEGFSLLDRGRSSFARSVATARKRDSGTVTPRFLWIFFCADSTAAKEIEVATEAIGGGLATTSFSSAPGVVGFEAGATAILMLLRSRWVSLASCAAWVAGYSAAI